MKIYTKNVARYVMQDLQELSPENIECDSHGQSHPRLLDHSLHVMAKRVELSTREFIEANKMSTPPGETLAGLIFTF